ncbi:hypothetical protein Afil01_30910 [Actinorhabdospora filicis]|uniref:HTH cro/C1-type domain-containing protein n=1 Tax=Actinorhabdospora filicis TaxID=1785913 RepID=A0A9W6SJN6_9ACTN|nr:helix-turn-helix transcriptional regulator [Actinorhabdospora filicis]GLZ78284.1 hypothetical protein Afil01_30910 [Actinorhabdospora filicis]
MAVHRQLQPNTRLRAARIALNLSQDDLATRLREAGVRLGDPNDASKRHVQRLESGQTQNPRPNYLRALEHVLKVPAQQLGFSPLGSTVGTIGGDDLAPLLHPEVAPDGRPAHENLSGIWLSRYEYVSSGRGGQTFTGLHYVVVLQQQELLTVRSIAGTSGSPLSMSLSVDGATVTGTWTEQTATDGYYRGARYHGAIQMLVEPTGRLISGQWVGFGKEMDVNVGPWELIFQSADLSRAAIAAYARPATDPRA